jgi:hypothetical protein
MKRIYITIILCLLCIFAIGCNDTYPLQTGTTTINPVSTSIETTVVTETVIVEDTAKIAELEQQIEQYKSLINNLNALMGNVYKTKVSNSEFASEGTGFSIKYNDKYYLISAGHGVHFKDNNTDILYTNFNANIKDDWISLKLLDYNNDYLNRKDYSIFVSDKITTGFEVDSENDNPLFIVSSLNKISDYRRTTIEGESGSPVIDIEGEVTEMSTTDMYNYNTDINTILNAIDNLGM